MQNLRITDPEVYEAIASEIERQESGIELIASENFTTLSVLEAQGSVLTNKYAEGYPEARWYGGCKFVDKIEQLAIDRAKRLFGAEHANVQPHSGTQANMAVYFAILRPGDTLMAMDIAAGGHLSHGHIKNFSGRLYKIVSYGVDKNTERINYNQILELAKKFRPKLIVAGACAYPRIIEFSKFKEIADKTEAKLLVDMAHIAGLVACGIHPTPIPCSDFVTTTTHKTLCGPRAGMVLCKKEYAKIIDAQVFPGIQGGPLMHIIAAKAVCFKQALTQKFSDYQSQVIKNAKRLSDCLKDFGYRIVSGGTDNHLLLIDLTSNRLTGNIAEEALDRAGITVNKNLIPFDSKPPSKTSGIRIGTPAVTTRGMGESQMIDIANLIDKVLSNIDNKEIIDEVKVQVKELTQHFPLYKNK